MKNYIALWEENLRKRKSFQLNGTFQIVGERKAHLGPRCEVATIRLTVTPAEDFQVCIDQLPNLEECEREGYLDAAVFGILDMLVLDANYPLTEIAILFTAFEIHPADSNVSAFRQAGRDAGRKILDAMRNNMFKRP